MDNPITRTPPVILDSGGIDESLPQVYEQEVHAVQPRRVKLHSQIVVFDILGDLFPEGKTVELDPPISLANIKLNIYAVDVTARDKRKARQLVDTVAPPIDRDTLEMTYGPGKYIIQASRADNGQMITQTTYDVAGDPAQNVPQAPVAGPQDMAMAITQAVTASLAPALAKLTEQKGPDKYTALLEKIALSQITDGGGVNSKIQQKITENALEIQAETLKQQMGIDRLKAASQLKLEEKKLERQWRKEDEATKFQQALMLKELEMNQPEDDVLEPPSSGTSVIAMAEIIQESLGLKKLELFGGMDLGTFIEPLAGKLEKALATKGYHVVTKKDLETMHEAGRQQGFHEGQATTIKIATKVRREIDRGSDAGQGGGVQELTGADDRAGVVEGDTGSVDG